MLGQIAQNGKVFGHQRDSVLAAPQALIDQVQAKRIEDDVTLTPYPLSLVIGH
jgi:hypothetical protein